MHNAKQYEKLTESLIGDTLIDLQYRIGGFAITVLAIATTLAIASALIMAVMGGYTAGEFISIMFTVFSLIFIAHMIAYITMSYYSVMIADYKLYKELTAFTYYAAAKEDGSFDHDNIYPTRSAAYDKLIDGGYVVPLIVHLKTK